MAKYELNPLPNDKILDVAGLKAFADAGLTVATVTISLNDRVENNVRKCLTAFSSFPFQCFQMPSLGS